MNDPDEQTEQIIAARLWKLCDTTWALNLFGTLKAADVLRYEPISDFVAGDERSDEAAWHFGRVRHFYDRIRNGLTVDPIDVDNRCVHGHIYPIPVVLDGHHRLVAATLARKRLAARYSGRIDLLDYLTGKRSRPPE